MPFEIERCKGCVFNCVGADGHPCAFVLVSMLPPPSHTVLHTGGTTAVWTQTGFWLVVRGAVNDFHLDAVVHRMITDALAAGGAPLFALEELAEVGPYDPGQEARELAVEADPARDAALASQRLECRGCGAPVSLVELTGKDARCPYCAAPVALSSELSRELALYQRRMHAALLRAPSLSIATLAGQARPSDRVALACMYCGAPNELRIGQVGGACASCGAALVPSRAAMARGVQLSGGLMDRAYRSASAASAQRTIAWARFGRDLSTFHVVLFLVGVVPFLWLPALPVVAVAAKLGVPWFVSAPLLFVAVCGLAAWAIRSVRKGARAQVERWHPRFEALATQLGAHTSTRPDDLVAWAERWWSDRLATDWLFNGRTYGLFFAHVAGFPIAISAHLELSKFPPQPIARRHLVVLLAARLPRDVAYWSRRGEVSRIIDDLRRAGFTLELRTGGLSLQAGDALADIVREPDRLALVAPLVFTVARLAHLLRAEPPTVG